MSKYIKYAVGQYSLKDNSGCTLEIFDELKDAEEFAQLNFSLLKKK